MRWTLGILGLLLGLAIAVILFGRIDHLRQVAPATLPDWTEAISDGSGIGSGRAVVEGPIALHWRWAGIAASGPSWQLETSRVGLTAAARARVPPPFDEVLFDRATAKADLLELVAPSPLGALGGTIQLDEGDGALRVADRQLTRLDGKGRILGASLDGRPIGNGTFTVTADVGGSWRLDFEMEGAALRAEGQLSGRIGQARATLDLRLVPGPEMPEDWQASLPMIADRDNDGGWRFRTTLP